MGMYIETKEHQPSSGHTTNAVQELEGLHDKVIWSLTVGLFPEVVLMQGKEARNTQQPY